MSKTRDVLPIGSTTFLRLQQSSDNQSQHEFFFFLTGWRSENTSGIFESNLHCGFIYSNKSNSHSSDAPIHETWCVLTGNIQHTFFLKTCMINLWHYIQSCLKNEKWMSLVINWNKFGATLLQHLLVFFLNRIWQSLTFSSFLYEREEHWTALQSCMLIFFFCSNLLNISMPYRLAEIHGTIKWWLFCLCHLICMNMVALAEM